MIKDSGIVERKSNSFTRYINEKLKLHLAISLGVFLFILFFQPFFLDKLDFNNRLIFIAGLAGIIFLLLLVIELIHLSLVKINEENETLAPSLILDIIFMALSSVSIAFYLRYVGTNTISFYIVFKILLICIFPVVLNRVNYRFQLIKSQNESLISKLKLLQKKVDKIDEEKMNASIELISENSKEKLNLLISDIICMQSADNYVSVIFKEGDSFRKMLMRNTLKNLELQLKPFSAFLRCHRTSIINIAYIEKLVSKYGNQWLMLKIYPERVPVSRQYLAMLKEVI